MKSLSNSMISGSSKLDIHKGSHRISKFKPKIRIIHVVAPEIIKTDVENFRDIVQRLTGKPSDYVEGSTDYKARRVSNSTKSLSSRHDQERPILMQSTKREIQLLQSAKRMKQGLQDIMMYKGDSSDGHFRGFGDMESFIQDLTTEFPLLPFKSSQINMFGEMPLC